MKQIEVRKEIEISQEDSILMQAIFLLIASFALGIFSYYLNGMLVSMVFIIVLAFILIVVYFSSRKIKYYQLKK